MNGAFFYIGLGLGLAAACGLRPYLPALLAGALGSAGALGVAFTGHFHFLQAGWWLVAVALVFVRSYLLQLRLGQERFQAVVAAGDPRAGGRGRRAAVRGHARRARRRLVAGADRRRRRGRAGPARVRPDRPRRPRAPARPRRARSADDLPRRRLAAVRGARLRCCTRSAMCCSRCSPCCSCAPDSAPARSTPACASSAGEPHQSSSSA